jgi:peptidoglycan hydrolase-like protein with peptidoglycan-binding domain
MRMVGVVLAVQLAALPGVAQTNTAAAQPGAAAKPAAQSSKLRTPAARAALLRDRAAQRVQSAVQPTDRAVPASGEGTQRLAAAAARKRAPVSAAPQRDTATPLAERIGIQLDLAWTSDYNGLIDGEINDKTTAAIKQFQRNRKLKETGVLSTQERALLAAAAKARQAQVGWIMVDDPATGARLGLPTKHVPHKTQSRSGTRWSSAQGQVQVETFRDREPGTTLAAVYEQQKKEPATRRLEVNLLRPDFFILAGMQNLKRFYVRAEVKDGEVRGMTVLYDQATETIMDPVAAVMAGVFTAFPGVSGATPIGAARKRRVEYGTGIVVSAAGHILTDRQLTDGCHVIVVSGYGDAARQAEDRGADLALLRVYGAYDLVPATFGADGAKNADLTLLGIADPQGQGGGGAISTLPARLRGDTVEPPPQLGFSGAAALDGQGQIVGMVALKMPVVANAGAIDAAPQAIVVPAQGIRAFLEGQQVGAAAARAGIDTAKASLVRIICVRK